MSQVHIMHEYADIQAIDRRSRKAAVASQPVHIGIDKAARRFTLRHPHNEALWHSLKKAGGYWQKDRKEWIFKGENSLYKKVCDIITQSGCRYTVEKKQSLLERETHPLVRRFLEALTLKNYSPSTAESYHPHFSRFVTHFQSEDINTLSYTTLKDYVADVIRQNDYSETQIRHLVSAIKFYYEKMSGRPKMYFKTTPAKPIEKQRLIIAHPQLADILTRINSPRERLLVVLHFGIGLTADEIAGLTLTKLRSMIQQPQAAYTALLAALKTAAVANWHLKPTQTFVFEATPAQAPEAQAVQQVMNRLCTKHKLIEIYNAEFEQALKQANFDYASRKLYLSGYQAFLRHFDYRHPQHITNDEIRSYLLHCRTEKQRSTSYINAQISLLRFCYTHIAGRKIENSYLPRPRGQKKLPEILSPGEVLRMIEKTENLKHKNIIAILYASGLRRSELINLKINDIDTERKVLTIRQGKGRKDRQTNLATTCETLLEAYIACYKPVEYLFEGAAGNRYSATSIEKVVKQAAQRAGITKHITPHSLRHTYATHLLESAVDIRYIQQLLGHSNIKTTERYTHVAKTAQHKVGSPLDRIQLTHSGHDTNQPP